MTTLNTVLPTVTQDSLSADEQVLYKAMHEAMGKEAVLMLVANGAPDSATQRDMIKKATRAIICLAQTSYDAAVERGVM